MKKRILSIALCLFLLFGLAACGEGEKFTPSQKAFDTEVQSSAPTSDEVIAQNGKYSLEYDSLTGAVRLVETATGTKWEVCPTAQASEDNPDAKTKKKNPIVQSALRVGYMDPNISGGGSNAANSYSEVFKSGRMVYKPIENGVTIEYYFDSQQFMIPVDYVLKDDYLSISIDSTKIQETDYKVTYISVTPFLCSVQNDSEDSYLFMPSGSGALIGADSYSNQGLTYEAYVYGDDLSMEKTYDTADEAVVRLPVYGYKQGDVGGFSIIDNGSDAAKLHVTTGNTVYGFSTIYPAFQLRGYSEHLARSFNNTYYTNIYPNNMLEGVFSVRFYPLSGETANYSSMADVYKNYLVDECGLTESDNEKNLNVNIIGGAEITKSFLGVPYTTVKATTTVEQANTIITELSEAVSNLSVKLKGFGTTGVDVGKIGGGFDINDNIGSVSQIKKLSELCTSNNIDLYMDYDLVRFSSSSSGFSYTNDVIMNCGYIKSEQYIIDKASRGIDENFKYRLLRPIKFNDAVAKAVSTNEKWNLGGMSLETMTSLSYADYSDYNQTVKYNAKFGFGEAVSDAISGAKEKGQKIMATEANAYAAVLADIITDVPYASNEGFAFEENVPFYSMVFKGYVPMTTEAINLAVTPQKAILSAVEGGIGLNYTVINTWDNSLIDSIYPYFYSTTYSSVKDDMIAVYNDLSNYYESIKGAKIKSNTVVAPGVHCTVFDNNVTVYVNYNKTSAQTPVGEIGAYDYIISGGATQ